MTSAPNPLTRIELPSGSFPLKSSRRRVSPITQTAFPLLSSASVKERPEANFQFEVMK